MNYESLQREADFRFSLVRIRGTWGVCVNFSIVFVAVSLTLPYPTSHMRIKENAESIAFYGGETLEERETRLRFNRTVDNRTQLNYAQTKLNFFTNTYYHLVNILPLCILANEFFAGMIEYGVINQVRDAFWHIFNDFSVIIGQFNGIASFIASIDRLFLFMKKIQELDPSRSNEDASVLIAKESINPLFDSSGGIMLKEYDAFDDSSWPISSRPVLLIRNLRLMTPDDKRMLIRRLNLTLSMGQNLLIAGVSGAGKSSLLRAIAGLWKNGDGEITRSRDVYFLPQRP